MEAVDVMGEDAEDWEMGKDIPLWRQTTPNQNSPMKNIWVNISNKYELVVDLPIPLICPVQQTPEKVTEEAVIALGGDVLAMGVGHVPLDVGVLLVEPSQRNLTPVTKVLQNVLLQHYKTRRSRLMFNRNKK